MVMVMVTATTMRMMMSPSRLFPLAKLIRSTLMFIILTLSITTGKAWVVTSSSFATEGSVLLRCRRRARSAGQHQTTQQSYHYSLRMVPLGSSRLNDNKKMLTNIYTNTALWSSSSSAGDGPSFSPVNNANGTMADAPAPCITTTGTGTGTGTDTDTTAPPVRTFPLNPKKQVNGYQQQQSQDLVDRIISSLTTTTNTTAVSSRSSKRISRRRSHSSSSSMATVTAATLGDIMSSGLTTETTSSRTSGGGGSGIEDDDATSTLSSSSSSSITSSSSSLARRFGITHPLDRMALTANGNLQRLVSSYYDAPVAVVVEYQELQQQQHDIEVVVAAADSSKTTTTAASASPGLVVPHPPPQVWNRVVRLCVHNQTFCTARSTITVRDALCQQLVESGHVGLGQLFRFLDLLPEFTLLKAGKTTKRQQGKNIKDDQDDDDDEDTGFWRDYRLDCNELSCQIHEEFCPGMWQLEPSGEDDGEVRGM